MTLSVKHQAQQAAFVVIEGTWFRMDWAMESSFGYHDEESGEEYTAEYQDFDEGNLAVEYEFIMIVPVLRLTKYEELVEAAQEVVNNVCNDDRTKDITHLSELLGGL